MNPINNQPTPDDIQAISEYSGISPEILTALWDKETGRGTGVNGKQNHFGPWELTASTYNSYVTREAKDKFKGFPTDIRSASKDQILAVSAEKLRRDWDAAGGNLRGFLVRWQGNHPTIGIQNVDGIEVKQADYSFPIVAYNARQLTEKGPDAKLVRNYNSLPDDAKAQAKEFYKNPSMSDLPMLWKVGPTEGPKKPTDALDFVMQALSASPEPSPRTAPALAPAPAPGPAQQAYQNLLMQYQAAAQQINQKLTAVPKSIFEAFDLAAFRNYQAPRALQSLDILKNQVIAASTLAKEEKDTSSKLLAENLRLERAALEVEKAKTNLEATQTLGALRTMTEQLKKTEAELKVEREQLKNQGLGADKSQPPSVNAELQKVYTESVDAVNAAKAKYEAMKDRIATPEGLAARDKYLQTLKNHVNVASQALKQKTPTNADLGALAELQVALGLEESDASSTLPADTAEQIGNYIRSKGGSVEKAIDEVFGKASPESVTLRNIMRGKPNAVGQNAKQALQYSPPEDLTPHFVRGIKIQELQNQFFKPGKRTQLNAILEGAKSESEKLVAEQMESRRIVDVVTRAYSTVAPYGSGPLALRQKIGDTIAQLRLDPKMYPQLSQMNIDEGQLIPQVARLVNSRVLNINEAAGQIAQFYSDLAKRKDSITRAEKLHVTLPKDWTVAFGKKAIDMTKASQVDLILRDELVRQQMIGDNVLQIELPPFFAP